jgi:hypothetical protein
MASSLVLPLASSMWIRWRVSPAPVVVDQSRSASAALMVELQAVEDPNPLIFW